MNYPAKRKQTRRAHRYRVLAQQLQFHLTTNEPVPEADRCIESAQRSLLEAAAILERELAGAGRMDVAPAHNGTD